MVTIHTPCSPSSHNRQLGFGAIRECSKHDNYKHVECKDFKPTSHTGKRFMLTVKHWETFETDKHNMEKGSKPSIYQLRTATRILATCRWFVSKQGTQKKKIAVRYCQYFHLWANNYCSTFRMWSLWLMSSLKAVFPGRGCEGFGGSSSQGPQDAEAPAKIPWNSQQKMYRKCRVLGCKFI